MFYNHEVHACNAMSQQCNSGYYAILQFHDGEFAIDRSQKTLKLTVNDKVIGQAVEMSKMVILKLDKLYR